MIQKYVIVFKWLLNCQDINRYQVVETTATSSSTLTHLSIIYLVNGYDEYFFWPRCAMGKKKKKQCHCECHKMRTFGTSDLEQFLVASQAVYVSCYHLPPCCTESHIKFYQFHMSNRAGVRVCKLPKEAGREGPVLQLKTEGWNWHVTCPSRSAHPCDAGTSTEHLFL